jgi:hypothetical protein
VSDERPDPHGSPRGSGRVYPLILTVGTAAEVAAWRALDETPDEHSGYDYQYEPDKEHPHGYRLVGSRIIWKGVLVSIGSRAIDLPSPDSDDAATVLAFAAADAPEGPAQP